ncbi:CU044_2847 family protein [Nonomuraea rubra]
MPLPEGETILVEVTGQVDDIAPAGRAREVVGRLPEAFETGLERAHAFMGAVIKRMRDHADKPDTVTVEFGLKLTATTGLVIAESSGEAHMTVTAEWRTRRDREPEA